MAYCSAPVFHGGLWGRSPYRVAHKFLLLVWYTDDAFLIWYHRAERLRDFWKYTDNLGAWDSLPAWISVVTETEDVCFGFKVYRKAIRTNEYLNATSHDHPVLCTVAPRPKTTSDQDSHQAELDTFQTTFRSNGCRSEGIQRTLHPPKHIRPPQHHPTTVAFLIVMQNTFYCLSRIL